VFPILEMLLGGSGKIPAKINREITEIEQSIMEGLLRIVLHDLRTAWHAVTTIDFATFIGIEMPAELPHLRAWHDRVSARPSAAA